MAIDDAPTILGTWPAAPAVGHRRAVDSGLRGAARNTRCTHKAGGVQGLWPATTAETSPAAWTRRASALTAPTAPGLRGPPTPNWSTPICYAQSSATSST